jgi:dihydroxyacid dehydratase/phosphogluconate dehydratase
MSDDLVERLDQQATLLQKHGQYFIGTLLDEAAAEIRSLREQVARAEQFAENANCSERAGIVTWLRGKIPELRAIAEQCDTPHRDAFEAEADAHKSIADAIEAQQDKDTTP